MFRRILVAIDHSSISKQAFEQALALAKLTEANLMLLHVLSYEEEGSPRIPVLTGLDSYPGMIRMQALELYQQQWQNYESQGLAMLRSRAQEAADAGVRVEFTQSPGSPGRAICDLAQTWGADLVLVGRRGRSGLSELFLGSVSNYVLHHAPCSVLIAHRTATHSPEAVSPAQVGVVS
ncbi:MAG: universal stress protein [Trichocoleus desertorum ATA4-8-CV12]|jgi:nucleotide-binding universal stress UspA family protein|nr:universal stress protein [Trichocoleus desertorum ATA4-8-CV12]